MTAQAALLSTFSLTGQSGCDTVAGVDLHESRPLNPWFETPLGRRCLAAEQGLVRRALETVFGEQLLQIGGWGPADSFLRFARTQRRSLIDWRDGVDADLITDPGRLAVASDSIDAVLLPHTLELTDSPHALLREVDRVLRADGHLVTLSFKPGGLWGLRHALSPRGYPAGQRRMIGERRLRDWLELLHYEVGRRQRYCHGLPVERLRRFGRLPDGSTIGNWLPFLSAGFLLKARKCVYPLTPIRPAWPKPRLKAVGGLVEPSTRTSESRLRQ
jgi:SAM-dependent methyltransferase